VTNGATEGCGALDVAGGEGRTVGCELGCGVGVGVVADTTFTVAVGIMAWSAQ
jgi:hypothetical protein